MLPKLLLGGAKLDHRVVFSRKTPFFVEHWQKSTKIVTVTCVVHFYHSSSRQKSFPEF
jgi:hypothetical protein